MISCRSYKMHKKYCAKVEPQLMENKLLPFHISDCLSAVLFQKLSSAACATCAL